jgi:hypothetical protein
MDCLASIPKRVLGQIMWRKTAYAIKYRRICFNPCKGFSLCSLNLHTFQPTIYRQISFDIFNVK